MYTIKGKTLNFLESIKQYLRQLILFSILHMWDGLIKGKGFIIVVVPYI